MRNVKRTSASRRQQSAQTKGRILEAAYQLFCELGWEATTMQAVADAAGVAVQTVYFIFGTKAQLLAEVEERTILGDQPLPAFFQDWATSARAESDPRSLIRLFVERDVTIKRRLAPLVAGLGSSLPEGRDRESGRDHFFRSVVDRLADLGALNESLTRDRALDLARVLNGQASYSDLTRSGGWTDEEWIDWMIALLASQLLKAEV